MGIFSQPASALELANARTKQIEELYARECTTAQSYLRDILLRMREVTALNTALRRANSRIKRQKEALKVYRDKERLASASASPHANKRANALRDAICQMWSATGAYSETIPALAKAALERDNDALDRMSEAAPTRKEPWFLKQRCINCLVKFRVEHNRGWFGEHAGPFCETCYEYIKTQVQPPASPHAKGEDWQPRPPSLHDEDWEAPCGQFIRGGSSVAPDIYCSTCGFRKQDHEPLPPSARPASLEP